MKKLFKVDVITLIELIKHRPCLWDKSLDCFKDRLEKHKAWMEVYAGLDEEFLLKGAKEKKKIGDIIGKRWINVRDSFVKSLKRKPSDSFVRNYIYHDHLQFLLKVIQIDQPNIPAMTLSPTEEIVIKDEDVETDDEYGNDRKKLKHDAINEDILEMEDAKLTPDEDEAFFTSIIPSVRKMSEENKLEFRIEVLQLIKNIHNRDRSKSKSVYARANSFSRHQRGSHSEEFNLSQSD